MIALSSTTVQKTMKVEATTVFARAYIGTGGIIASPTDPATATNLPIAINGASKGIATVTKNDGTGGTVLDSYTVTFSPSVPVFMYLGVPAVNYLAASSTGGAGTGRFARVLAETVTTAVAPASFTVAFYDDAAVLKPLSSGDILLLTVVVSPSNVF